MSEGFNVNFVGNSGESECTQRENGYDVFESKRTLRICTHVVIMLLCVLMSSTDRGVIIMASIENVLE